jgi:type IV secretory pathway TraG/TraD family ATPase VirD4
MNGPAASLRFGALDLSAHVATRHFLLVGTTGSGKTTLLRLLEQSALRDIGVSEDCRAIVNDPKNDVVPQLAAIAPDAELVITNPFDVRSTAWDVAADVNEPQVAIEFAYNLIPHQPESQPFFSDASRHLVVGVVTSFMLSGIDWTIADLIHVLQSARNLKAVLKRHPETRDLVPLYLSDRRLASNILSTVATKLLPFGPVAAAWEQASSRKSLAEWSRSAMIWVLGNSEVSRVPIQTLNRCMFKRACDLTLSQSESTTRRNWFIIDELADAGKLDGLVSLAKKGRSKGACLAIAFQSVAGLRDAQLYGAYFSEEILAQFGHKFIGRVECASSGEWASLLVGDQEIEQVSTSVTSGRHGSSSTKNRQLVVRRGMLASEFMDFPPCDRTNGLTGVFFVPGIGVFSDTLPGSQLFDHDLMHPAENVAAFVPRPVEQQYLRPWSAEQAAVFGIDVQKTPSVTPRQESERNHRSQDSLDDLF